jgi:hypothetical protein
VAPRRFFHEIAIGKATLKKIPEMVQQFIAKYIHSLDELEILLLLQDNPQKEWAPSAIARLLGLDLNLTKLRLRRLETLELVAGQHLNEERFYRYDLSSPEEIAALGQLAKLYSTHRVNIITLIFTQPLDRIQTFAEGHRSRNNEDENK